MAKATIQPGFCRGSPKLLRLYGGLYPLCNFACWLDRDLCRFYEALRSTGHLDRGFKIENSAEALAVRRRVSKGSGPQVCVRRREEHSAVTGTADILCMVSRLTMMDPLSPAHGLLLGTPFI